MNKQEFLSELREKLSGLPCGNVEESLCFYSEIIDDKIEDGLTEEDAIREIGSTEKIASQIISELSFTRLVKEKLKPSRRLSVLEIVLLLLTSPVWISLLISALAVILSLYVSSWSVIVSIWATFVSLIGAAFGGALSGVILMLWNNVPSGLALISASLVAAGLSIFLFYGCKAATRGFVLLTKSFLLWIKKSLIKKEAA